MNKKVLIVLIIVIALVSGYFYLRYSVLKSKDFKPDLSKSKSELDLRPALIAKMRQLVKDGSNGLYNLQITQVEPSVTQASVDFIGVVLTPDPSGLARLDSLHMAPDDVFKISFKTLHIGGIGIADLLNKKEIDLSSIIVDEPVIEVFHKERSYNAGKRLQNDTLTLYQKITRHFTSIAINKIVVKSGQFISHISKDNKTTSYNKVSVELNDLLIDSSTQYDANRFLFAKKAGFSVGKYSLPTPDSLYFFSCNSVIVSAESRRLTATGIELTPRFTKEAFQRKIQRRQDRYTIKIPKLVLSGVDWWKLVNNDKLIAQQADIYNGSLSNYVDMRKPAKEFKINNYPHQAIMNIKMPINIEKVQLHNMSVTYEELSDASLKRGTAYFDKIDGEMQNLTNIPAQFKKDNLAFRAKALFMKKVPIALAFTFNLARHKTGAFSADVYAGAMDHTIPNQLAEPLGLFNLKTGNIKEATAHMYGDNKEVNCDFLMLYNNLYIVPLKKDEEVKSGLRKKKIIGALANLLLIKKANPDNSGDVRRFKYVVPRKQHPNFFNQLWKTILTGIIKSIGAPEKLAK
ncbi:MAG TPA: hypothetical protein VF622_14875 [Segetibacter sp.]|jgi:hypothetical protein